MLCGDHFIFHLLNQGSPDVCGPLDAHIENVRSQEVQTHAVCCGSRGRTQWEGDTWLLALTFDSRELEYAITRYARLTFGLTFASVYVVSVSVSNIFNIIGIYNG